MITVLFQTESHYPVNRQKIKSALNDALKDRVHGNTEVSVSIVGHRQMRSLNNKYRQKDVTTDVLSFPLNDPADRQAPFVSDPDEILRLGDILVCYPIAVELAAAENKLVDDKIIELMLHGLDHLLGIHHPD